MIRCLDIHTHHVAPQPLAVIALDLISNSDSIGKLLSSEETDGETTQLYSIGIHPWETEKNLSPRQWATFEKLVSHPWVAAIGECGIDKLKGGPLFKQLIVMNKQIEISEKLHKPLIIHDVKAHDVIVGLKRDLNPAQKWVVHGFRGKPSVAKMLTDAGIYLSFGEKFNPDTPITVPQEKILAETDDSSLSIEEIINNLSLNLGKEIRGVIEQNTNFFLFGEKSGNPGS